MTKYTEAYYTFKVGDRVSIKRTSDQGHEYVGKVIGIWSGKPFAWPFLVRHESPIWPGEYVDVWCGPHEMTVTK